MSLTEQLLRPVLKSSASRPLLTHYDEAVGGRVELSVTTMANWAAKTANWLVEEFDIEPGDAVSVNLPAHWQTAGVLLGSWWCGAHVIDDPAAAAVSFVSDDSHATTDHPFAVVALDPLVIGFAADPANASFVYLIEARGAGDEFSPLLPVPGDTEALLGATIDVTVATARETAEKDGLSAGDRVLSTQEWGLPNGVMRGLLGPLVVGAHLVQVSGGTAEQLAARRDAERTTVDLPG